MTAPTELHTQISSIDLTPASGVPSPSITFAPGTTRWVVHVHFDIGHDGLQTTNLGAALPASVQSAAVILHPRGTSDDEPSVATIGLIHGIVGALWPLLNTPLNKSATEAAGGPGRAAIVGLERMGAFFADAEHRVGLVSMGVHAEAAAQEEKGAQVAMAVLPPQLGGEGDDDLVPAALLGIRAPTFEDWKAILPPAEASDAENPPAPAA